MAEVIIDITEFIGNPVRTGIQRIVREVLKNWPDDIPHMIVAFQAGVGFYRAPRKAVDFAIEGADRDDLTDDTLRATVAALNPEARRERYDIPPRATILAPELFFDPHRVFAHRMLAEQGSRIHYIVPDFLVWLNPDLFKLHDTGPFMPYLERLMHSEHLAFISPQVQHTFSDRILRRPDSPVGMAFDLGADSLGVHKVALGAEPRRDFLFVGSLDGRKGQDIAYEAFIRTPGNENFTLTFMGRVFERNPPELKSLLTTKRKNVRVIGGASDATIAEHLSRARASIYVSEIEGYGLPPMESLHAGVPVVVSRDLPALEGKSADGQIRLDKVTVDTVRSAFIQLMDDRAWKRLWKQAEGFETQTWSGYAQQIADWVEPRKR